MLDQLDNLTSKLLDAGLDASERSLLNQLLAHEECRLRFVELNKVHYCLALRSVPANTLLTARATSAVHDSILSLANGSSGFNPACDVGCGAGAGQRMRSSRRRLVRIVTGLAAMAAVGLLLYFALPDRFQSSRPELPRGSDRDVARTASPTDEPRRGEAVKGVVDRAAPAESFAARVVSMSEDTLWVEDAVPGEFLMRLVVGEELKLARGLVKLEFASKARVVLSGPVDLKILGRGSVLLKQGKLTGKSEQGDFTVQTPSAYVVDVGTAFGVAVDDKAVTDVVVFDGEVHVRRSSASIDNIRLTSGMSVRADRTGLNRPRGPGELTTWNREFNGKRPSNLGAEELSLVDIICGSDPGEYRFAGSIDPEMGTWSTLPWSETKGVHGKSGTGEVVGVDWNPWVHGIFIPQPNSGRMVVDLDGGSVEAPALVGGAWGPVWARRRIERHLDPLSAMADRDVEGFWGAGTTTALLDRSRWLRDGIVGMHANVGITLDLRALRHGYAASLESLRGVLAHLEQSYVSQPFQPQARSTFQIFVDGQLRYERVGFCRQDGDAVFGVEIDDIDRFLSLIVTDGNDGPVYDRVILMDPLFEIRRE